MRLSAFPAPRTAAAANACTLVVDSDGSLWAWGDNWKGTLGTGDMLSRTTPTRIGADGDWRTIVAGGYHALALKTDGSLWAWGANWFAQLGTGDGVERTVPTRIGTDTDWQAIVAGLNHTIALKSDGSLWAWGRNEFGQLGTGDTTLPLTPARIGTDTDWRSIATGYAHTVALKSDGSLWAWGGNQFGQLGTGDTTDRMTPTRIGAGNDWLSIDAGYEHTVAVRADGSLWTWGRNEAGQLGTGDTVNPLTPTRIGGAKDWLSIDAGYGHTVAFRADGSLWVWGLNGQGQLGTGDITNRKTPTRIGAARDWRGIDAGYLHTVAFKTDGSCWAWGAGWSGRLGTGDATDHPTPTRVRFPVGYREFTGSDRYETAVLLSMKAYPFGAPAVFVVKGDDFPDALAAAPLAAAYGGPIIITPSSGLTSALAEELKRLNPSKVFFVGLADSVMPGIQAALPVAEVITIRGQDRYETAVLLAEELKKKLGTIERVVLAPGDKFPDALSVAPLAAKNGWAIVLTPQTGPLPKVTAEGIGALGVTQGLRVGTWVKFPAQVTSVVSRTGVDRYDMNLRIADFGTSRGLSFAHVALLTGENYPDALVAAPYLVGDGGVLLLTHPEVLSTGVRDVLVGNAPDVRKVDIVGLGPSIHPAVKGILE